MQLEQKNNAARQAWWLDHAGTQFDIDAATAQRDAAANADLLNIFKPGQKADPQLVLKEIDSILGGPSGKRTSVKTSLSRIRNLIEEPASKNKPAIQETDPETLYNSVRKEIGDLLDKRSDDPAGQQAGRELTHVRDVLDKQIAKAAPGFDQYLADYADASKPITAMKFMQGLNLTDLQGNITLAKVDTALKQIEKGIKSGDATHPANSLNKYDRYALEALRDDLLRQTKTQSGITKGTSTYQRFATSAKLPSGGLLGKLVNPTTLGTGAGYGLGELIAPGWGSALGMMTGAGAGRVAENVLARRNALVDSALSYMLTNPGAFTPRAAVRRNNLAAQYGLPAAAPGLLQLLLSHPSDHSAGAKEKTNAETN